MSARDHTEKLTVIIATLNEEFHLTQLLEAIRSAYPALPVAVADGGSVDHTASVAARYRATFISCPKTGRAAQFNFAAAQATTPYLLFLHADSLPPADFADLLEKACAEGIEAACFRLRFDHTHWFLKANAWFTRFKSPFFRFGDQGLWLSRSLFFMAGAYNEKLHLLEDQEVVWRITRFSSLSVLPYPMQTSARRYLREGIYRLQFLFFLIWLRYYLGASQEELLRFYHQHISS